MFIFERERERETEHEWGEGQRERETQNPIQAPGSALSAQSPPRGSNPQTVRSWPEPKLDSQPTEPPRCPYKLWFWKSEVWKSLIQIISIRKLIPRKGHGLALGHSASWGSKLKQASTPSHFFQSVPNWREKEFVSVVKVEGRNSVSGGKVAKKASTHGEEKEMCREKQSPETEKMPTTWPCLNPVPPLGQCQEFWKTEMSRKDH